MSNNDDGNSKGQSGIYFKATHCLAAFMLVILLVIGVGVLVFFATDRDQPVCPGGPNTTPRWDICRQEVKKKQLCIVKCSLNPASTRLPPHSHHPTWHTHKSTHSSTQHPPSITYKPSRHTSKSPPDLTTTAPPINRRLPTGLYPLYYKLIFNPDIYGKDEQKFKFEGSLELKLRCDRSTDVITLHSRTLTYINDSISLKQINGSDIGINSYSFDVEREFIFVQLNERLKANYKYVLSLNFTGPIKKDLLGLYLSSYTRSDNSTAYIAITQMAVNNAREIFPCFDEPAFKSVFQISILRQSHMHSLSNMEITQIHSIGNGYEMDVYEDTVRMSTYILAFVVSDFVNSTVLVNGTKISVWTRPEYAGQADYALGLAAKILPYYGWYFGERFPLKKLDVFGVPDFIAGGMENWGLVVFRERYLLYNNRTTTTSIKRWVAIVMAHELAHMWFGNLVTLTWWSGNWLNQGFASYVTYLGIDHAEPSWKMFDFFRFYDTRHAMRLDSHKNAHPLHLIVDNDGQIDEFLDSIIYSKGAHVIKMMRFFIGDKHFREGLKLYIERHKYGSVNRTMLWDALKNASSIDVESVMETWVVQQNFPVVHIRRLKRNWRDSVSTTVNIRQERFLISKDEPESTIYTSPYQYKWRIPMTFVSNSPNYTDQGIMWLNETKREQNYDLSFDLADKNWILGNPEDKIFCRTNYDLSNWRLLVRQLHNDHTKISTIDRSVLITDACDLARGGYVDITLCLEVISYIHAERDYSPLWFARRNLNYIDTMLQGTLRYHLFWSWLKPKVANVYDAVVTRNKTNSLDNLSLSLISKWACTIGYESCLDDMSNAYKLLSHTSADNIDPDLVTSIYCFGVKKGSVADWDKLYDDLENVTPARRNIIINALGCRNCDMWLLKRYLMAGITELRNTDLRYVFKSVGSTKIGRMIAFNAFRDKWDVLFEKLNEFAPIIREVTYSMNTKSDLEQLQSVMAAHPDHGTGAASLTSAVQDIKTNIAWMERNEDKIYDWLKKNQKYNHFD